MTPANAGKVTKDTGAWGYIEYNGIIYIRRNEVMPVVFILVVICMSLATSLAVVLS